MYKEKSCNSGKRNKNGKEVGRKMCELGVHAQEAEAVEEGFTPPFAIIEEAGGLSSHRGR